MDGAWVRCDVCGDDWPEDAYRAGGSAYTNRKRMCGACFQERYPRRYVPCTGCGRKMSTRGKWTAPMCRPCRARCHATPQRPFACTSCGEPIDGGAAHSDGRCYRCYLRAWRAEHGVNGRQTIGAWEQAA